MKSYWMTVTTHTDQHKAAVLSRFGSICDGMTVESARMLCDKETGRAKKLQAVMADQDGKRQLVTRTTSKNYTITFAPAPQPAAAAAKGDAAKHSGPSNERPKGTPISPPTKEDGSLA